MKRLEKAPAKTLSVTEFKAHCTEELRIIEETGARIAITRHGKTIAFVEAAKPNEPKTIGDIMGSLNGSIVFAADDDPEEPAIPYNDWAMHGDDPL